MNVDYELAEADIIFDAFEIDAEPDYHDGHKSPWGSF